MKFSALILYIYWNLLWFLLSFKKYLVAKMWIYQIKSTCKKQGEPRIPLMLILIEIPLAKQLAEITKI